jgi:hypothetical protein
MLSGPLILLSDRLISLSRRWLSGKPLSFHVKLPAMPKARKKIPSSSLVTRWRVALTNAGLKQGEWAAANGWTETHVSQVVAGKRESRAVTAAVHDFIAREEQNIAARAGQPAA